jgi:ornithine cyclodeaminase/alanine dehydrogenase-like protein (mu-crystallin family)
VSRGSAVRKTVKIVGTNVMQRTIPDQITVGKAFCVDASDNHITHIVEACLLSSARTGACAAIALRRLAVRPRRLVVFGAGRVGCYAAFYAATLADIEDITFVDVDEERARSAAVLAANTFACSTRFTAGRPDGRIDADALILATTADRPIIAPGDTGAALVVSAGADSLHQHELAREWASLADVYVDTMDSLQVGDLHAWVRDGLLERHQVVDLLGLVRSPPRPSARPRLFISTGSALFDNLTISYILEERSRAAAS